MSNLPPGVTMAMVDPGESACQRCGRFGDECVCPECTTCGAYGCIEHLPQEELEQMAWRHRYVADSVERELRSRGLEPNPFDSMNWISKAQADRINKTASYDDATLGPSLCTVCHRNYVDAEDGFDTCADCLARM